VRHATRDTPHPLQPPRELIAAIATDRVEADPDQWVDWEVEAETRTEMYQAALAAGCTDLQATTVVQLAGGLSARAIARHRGVAHSAVLGIRDRAMRRILRVANRSTPMRGDYWGAPSQTGITSKQRYVVSMRDWHGHTFTYIAANIGIRPQSVWRLYQRAMRWVEPGEIRGGGRPWGADCHARRPAGSGRMGHPPCYQGD
jgi:DNA-directed RNA polymerase specialized sigma24 family protein